MLASHNLSIDFHDTRMFFKKNIKLFRPLDALNDTLEYLSICITEHF